MRRRLFTMLSALSLLLCSAMVAVCARSYQTIDVLEVQEPGDSPFVVRQLWTQRGLLVFDCDLRGSRDGEEDGSSTLIPAERAWKLEHVAPADALTFNSPATLWNRLGFCHVEGDAHGELWTTPLWLLITAFAVGPALYVASAYKRGRRVSARLCLACDYDLRGTPDRCPECGTVPQQVQA